MEKLTKRQEDILKALKKFIASHGYPPTVREIGKAVDLRSTATVHGYLAALELKGYIKKENHRNCLCNLLVIRINYGCCCRNRRTSTNR